MKAARRPRPRRRVPADAGALLARSLTADAAQHGLDVRFTDWRSRPWASATFTGERHEAELTINGEGVAGWLAGLPALDLPLRGHLVAELLATYGDNRTLRLAALTLLHA